MFLLLFLSFLMPFLPLYGQSLGYESISNESVSVEDLTSFGEMEESESNVDSETSSSGMDHVPESKGNQDQAVKEMETHLPGLPNLENGRAKYERNCVLCHGASGSANSPVAQQLKVKPKSFADINPEDELDPSKAFQVITNGIPESQMPSFASLSVQDRWDIAAYIFTLRVDLPEVQRPSSSLSWNQVKDMSNQNILRRLQNQGIPETEQIKELSRLRRYPQ